MQNLLKLEDLTTEEIMDLLKSARDFKNKKDYTKLEDKVICNLFFEPSTRTHYSFNVAEKKLGMQIVNFNPDRSSLVKGETFYDTVKTFEAFNVDCFVIRHTQNNYYDLLKNLKAPVINAGDGTGNHPTQSLLDLMTIYEEFDTFKDLKIAIIGDIKHSRVAHGNLEIMKRLGMKTYVSGPRFFYEDEYEYIDFEEAIKEMDVIMLLRIQTERHNEKYRLTNNEYLNTYGLTMERVNRMKDTSIIMHPSPFNREVEIASDVVECSKSRIFKQIENGVFVRQAVIKKCLI